MATENEKPTALQVQHADETTTITDAQHHKELHVIPIEEEAVEDAYHIDLTWRSWVYSRVFFFSKNTTNTLGTACRVHHLLCVSGYRPRETGYLTRL